jgi:hypothetical protein
MQEGDPIVSSLKGHTAGLEDMQREIDELLVSSRGRWQISSDGKGLEATIRFRTFPRAWVRIFGVNRIVDSFCLRRIGIHELGRRSGITEKAPSRVVKRECGCLVTPMDQMLIVPVRYTPECSSVGLLTLILPSLRGTFRWPFSARNLRIH